MTADQNIPYPSSKRLPEFFDLYSPHILTYLPTEGNRLDERLRADEILSTLSDLAKTHNLPVVVISELSREPYKTGQRLGMTAFKESGIIVNHDGNIDLIVYKAKRGTGATGRIALKLNKSKMIVRDRIEATRASKYNIS